MATRARSAVSNDDDEVDLSDLAVLRARARRALKDCARDCELVLVLNEISVKSTLENLAEVAELLNDESWSPGDSMPVAFDSLLLRGNHRPSAYLPTSKARLELLAPLMRKRLLMSPAPILMEMCINCLLHLGPKRWPLRAEDACSLRRQMQAHLLHDGHVIDGASPWIHMARLLCEFGSLDGPTIAALLHAEVPQVRSLHSPKLLHGCTVLEVLCCLPRSELLPHAPLLRVVHFTGWKREANFTGWKHYRGVSLPRVEKMHKEREVGFHEAGAEERSWAANVLALDHYVPPPCTPPLAPLAELPPAPWMSPPCTPCALVDTLARLGLDAIELTLFVRLPLRAKRAAACTSRGLRCARPAPRPPRTRPAPAPRAWRPPASSLLAGASLRRAPPAPVRPCVAVSLSDVWMHVAVRSLRRTFAPPRCRCGPTTPPSTTRPSSRACPRWSVCAWRARRCCPTGSSCPSCAR